MPFGVYLHIPYCLQKCHYCDFLTLDLQHQIAPREYVSLLAEEIRQRARHLPEKKITSLYFGGGTPSLLPAQDILALVHTLANAGLDLTSRSEVTIEINPGTIDNEKLDVYLACGINRFSVGVQTFKNTLLQRCGREHSAEESVKTLSLLEDRHLNYSLDLLFGLPHQTMADLESDLNRIDDFSPAHISLYNLTVPQRHSMNQGRLPDELQAEMFDLVETRLGQKGLRRYEISNFAKPGFESRHNLLYWTNESYWGFGVSAHSYLRDQGEWGTRFWNPTSVYEWKKQVLAQKEWTAWPGTLPVRQYEQLKLHEALTDFFHTHLRKTEGFSWPTVEGRFGPILSSHLLERTNKLVGLGFLQKNGALFSLTSKGQKLSNKVFLELTFSPQDLPASLH